jgi:hypothetical protein
MFKELYYSIYSSLSSFKTNTNPARNAFYLMSFFQCLNVFSLEAIINYYFSLNINKATQIYFAIFIWVTITALNFYFIHRKRETIIMQFEGYSKKRQTKSKFYSWLYIILSLVFTFYVLANFVTPKY